MGAIIWVYEAEQAAGVFGEAQARLAMAEEEFVAMMFAWGATMVAGVYYFFSNSAQQNPPGGWRPDFMPICVPTAAPGGFEQYDDASGFAMNFNWEGAYGPGTGDPTGPPPV